MTERVTITEKAKKIVDQLRKNTPQLIFHQSGGCCDGSSPMCFPKNELMLNENDIWLGQVYGCDFYMSKDQFEYWKHTQLTLDVVEGRGASFSLEIPLGVRFMIRSRMFTEQELADLPSVQNALENNL